MFQGMPTNVEVPDNPILDATHVTDNQKAAHLITHFDHISGIKKKNEMNGSKNKTPRTYHQQMRISGGDIASFRALSVYNGMVATK